MKTAELELTKTELYYLANLVISNIQDGTYWGNKDEFAKNQTKVFSKLCESGMDFDLDLDSCLTREHY
jgi:hypothetical protein